MYKTIFREIKNQLLNGGELLTGQREYIVSAIALIESGQTLEQAFANAELPTKRRGKCSSDYQSALARRNELLAAAVGFFDGSDWKKCERLANACSAAWRKHRAGNFQPAGDVDRLIKRILDSGLRPPLTSPGVYAAIFKKIKRI